MFDKLIEWVLGFWDSIVPWEIVDTYEGGVILRFGKFSRTIAPGFNWKIPFAEHAVTVKTCITTLPLGAQSLTTKDDKACSVATIVKYSIKDVKPFLLDIWDSVDVLQDVTKGAVKEIVNNHTWAELLELPIETLILETVRKEVNQYGFKVHKITFSDMSRMRTLRIIQTQETINK